MNHTFKLAFGKIERFLDTFNPFSGPLLQRESHDVIFSAMGD